MALEDLKLFFQALNVHHGKYPQFLASDYSWFEYIPKQDLDHDLIEPENKYYKRFLFSFFIKLKIMIIFRQIEAFSYGCLQFDKKKHNHNIRWANPQEMNKHWWKEILSEKYYKLWSQSSREA